MCFGGNFVGFLFSDERVAVVGVPFRMVEAGLEYFLAFVLSLFEGEEFLLVHWLFFGFAWANFEGRGGSNFLAWWG